MTTRLLRLLPRAGLALPALALPVLALLALVPVTAAIPDEGAVDAGPCAVAYDARGPFLYEAVWCAGVELVAYETHGGWAPGCEVRVAGETLLSCLVP